MSRLTLAALIAFIAIGAPIVALEVKGFVDLYQYQSGNR